MFVVGGVLILVVFVLSVCVLFESYGECGWLDVGGMLGFSLMLVVLILVLLWLGEFGLYIVCV